MTSPHLLNGRYELLAQQGSGGMSVIYKAFDTVLKRYVAIKVLRPSLTTDAAFLDKFRQEAQSVANLIHPNIVTVHDVGNDGTTHFIVMELVEGRDLKKIIKDQGALPVDRVLKLAIQICAGIGYAHRSGLVHADVKPQNVLVTPQDVVKVTDFGIAQALSDTQPQQRQDVVWGSPHYFAPEQARGEMPSPSADVYAIGIVMFEMLTGRQPYTGANQQELAMAHIKNPVPLVTEFNPAVPEALARIVYKVMSKEPQNRYRMADQLGHVLQNYQDRSHAQTMANPQSFTPPPTVQSQQVEAPPSQQPPSTLPPAPDASGVTARYGAAPHAPNPYNPQQQRQTVVPPQPLQQRYTAPGNSIPAPGTPPPQPPDAARYRAQYQSQPLSSQQVPEVETGPDYVTIALAFLAIIAVGGLCPLFFIVIQLRAG